MKRAARHPEVSVVVPLFEEEGNVQPLTEEICAALSGREYEVLLVDDASRDGTWSEMLRTTEAFAGVRLLRHAHNAGQSAALGTGLHAARGRVVATLDGDRQNDPADIPRLLAFLEADPGLHAVCGVRARRQDSFVRRASSRLGNGFRNWVTGDHFPDSGCALRVIRREALVELPIFNGVHRFLPTLLRAAGLRVESIAVGHRQRTVGRSKYGIRNRLGRGIFDCVAVRWWRRRAVPAACLRCPPQPGFRRASRARAPSATGSAADARSTS